MLLSIIFELVAHYVRHLHKSEILPRRTKSTSTTDKTSDLDSCCCCNGYVIPAWWFDCLSLVLVEVI